MSKLRKDNYVVTSDGVYGKIVKMGERVILQDSNGDTQEYGRNELVKISAADYREATQQLRNDNSSVNTEVKAKKTTKADIAREVFGRLYGTEGIRRKDIIEAMIAEAGLTKAGAGTYYYNMTKALKNES